MQIGDYEYIFPPPPSSAAAIILAMDILSGLPNDDTLIRQHQMVRKEITDVSSHMLAVQHSARGYYSGMQ